MKVESVEWDHLRKEEVKKQNTCSSTERSLHNLLIKRKITDCAEHEQLTITRRQQVINRQESDFVYNHPPPSPSTYTQIPHSTSI